MSWRAERKVVCRQVLDPNQLRNRRHAAQVFQRPSSPMTSRPPGVRTRAISSIACCGSRMKQRTVIAMTMSNLIVEGECLDVTEVKVDGDTGISCASAGDDEHRLGDVDSAGHSPTACRLDQIDAVAASDIEQPPVTERTGQVEDDLELPGLGDRSEDGSAPAFIGFGLCIDPRLVGAGRIAVVVAAAPQNHRCSQVFSKRILPRCQRRPAGCSSILGVGSA